MMEEREMSKTSTARTERGSDREGFGFYLGAVESNPRPDLLGIGDAISSVQTNYLIFSPRPVMTVQVVRFRPEPQNRIMLDYFLGFLFGKSTVTGFGYRCACNFSL